MTVNAKQKIIVCDTNTALVPSLRKRFSARIDGFDEKRVLASTRPADEALPEVLNLLLGKKAPATGQKKAKRGKKKAVPQKRQRAEKPQR